MPGFTGAYRGVPGSIARASAQAWQPQAPTPSARLQQQQQARMQACQQQLIDAPSSRRPAAAAPAPRLPPIACGRPAASCWGPPLQQGVEQYRQETHQLMDLPDLAGGHTLLPSAAQAVAQQLPTRTPFPATPYPATAPKAGSCPNSRMSSASLSLSCPAFLASCQYFLRHAFWLQQCRRGDGP